MPRQERAVLTVARIRKTKGAVEYLFNERERIFTLAEGATRGEESARRLEEAFRRRRPLAVALDPKRAVIVRAQEPTRAALEAFTRARVPLEEPDEVVPIEVEEIDPSTFNVVDRYLK